MKPVRVKSNGPSSHNHLKRQFPAYIYIYIYREREREGGRDTYTSACISASILACKCDSVLVPSCPCVTGLLLRNLN